MGTVRALVDAIAAQRHVAGSDGGDRDGGRRAPAPRWLPGSSPRPPVAPRSPGGTPRPPSASERSPRSGPVARHGGARPPGRQPACPEPAAADATPEPPARPEPTGASRRGAEAEEAAGEPGPSEREAEPDRPSRSRPPAPGRPRPPASEPAGVRAGGVRAGGVRAGVGCGPDRRLHRDLPGAAGRGLGHRGDPPDLSDPADGGGISRCEARVVGAEDALTTFGRNSGRRWLEGRGRWRIGSWRSTSGRPPHQRRWALAHDAEVVEIDGAAADAVRGARHQLGRPGGRCRGRGADGLVARAGRADAQAAAGRRDHAARRPARSSGRGGGGDPPAPSRRRRSAARAASPPSELRLTHPARWGSLRREKLAEAAALADLPEPVFVPEPVAAAVHFVDERIEDGVVRRRVRPRWRHASTPRCCGATATGSTSSACPAATSTSVARCSTSGCLSHVGSRIAARRPGCVGEPALLDRALRGARSVTTCASRSAGPRRRSPPTPTTRCTSARRSTRRCS